MKIAAPLYIQKKVSEGMTLPPGHRFYLYFPYWEDNWSELRPRKCGKDWPEVSKVTALQSIVNKISDDAKKLRMSITERQMMLTRTMHNAASFVCRLTSPVLTGLGNAHPIENGFAFLSPYGIPYLAGSGIKGVLRRSAELMALFPEEYPEKYVKEAGLTMLDVWWLFGFEGTSFSAWPNPRIDDCKWVNALRKHRDKLLARNDLLIYMHKLKNQVRRETLASAETFIDALFAGNKSLIDSISRRGALSFWDAFPQCDEMTVEIMTPHYSDYYQNGKPPHDAGQPNPIPFLAVPADKQVNLFVQCRIDLLPEKYDWLQKIEKILEFGAKWQGFGSKTAIGYGALEIDKGAMETLRKKAEEAERARAEAERKASMKPEELKLEEFRLAFEAIKEKEKVYRPGQGQLDSKRNEFLKECLNWTDAGFRKQAAAILDETFIWGKPSKTDKKNELRLKIDQLKS